MKKIILTVGLALSLLTADAQCKMGKDKFSNRESMQTKKGVTGDGILYGYSSSNMWVYASHYKGSEKTYLHITAAQLVSFHRGDIVQIMLKNGKSITTTVVRASFHAGQSTMHSRTRVTVGLNIEQTEILSSAKPLAISINGYEYKGLAFGFKKFQAGLKQIIANF